MELLVLGGTEFVGRAVAEAAVERGWEVTVFHRGRHPAPAGVRVLTGDREGDLSALAEGRWDAVVDTWSAAPDAVRASAQLLKERAGRYAYVSSRSVYAYPMKVPMHEGAELVEAGGEDYAALKRGGELAAEEAFGERALLVRAGLVLGPWENIGRLPWWLNRVARGGEVPAPGPRDLPLQYVDVRDLAAWILDAVAAGLGGPYNVVSPSGHATMGDLLDACVAVTGAEATLRWVAPEAVEAAGAEPWTELPVWVPPGPLHDALHRGDVSKALGSGLRCRPVASTVADTWAWLRSLPGPAPLRPDRPSVGLPPAKDAALLGSA